MVPMSLDDLQALMREVTQESVLSPASDFGRVHPQLSPASTVTQPPGNEDVPQPVAQSASAITQPTQQNLPCINTEPTSHNTGMDICSLFHSPLSSLPPLSTKLIKAMKSREYIDLNTLLLLW